MKPKCVWLCERCAQMIGYDYDIQATSPPVRINGKQEDKKCCQECGNAKTKQFSNYYAIKGVKHE